MLTMAVSSFGILVAPLVVCAIGVSAIITLGALVALLGYLLRDWL